MKYPKCGKTYLEGYECETCGVYLVTDSTTAEKLLFPRATNEAQDIGWTLDYTYLMLLHDTLRAKYEDAPSMEQIELVLLEIEKDNWAQAEQAKEQER